MKRRAWFTWETQRRNAALADAFSCDYLCFNYDHQPPPLRYIFCTARTLSSVLRNRYDLVFAQSPSIILAALVALLKWPLGYLLVIDAHNIVIEQGLGGPWLIKRLIRYAFSQADYVLVSNAELCQAVVQLGGHPLILPDRVPTIESVASPKLIKNSKRPIITLISSFANDEPIESFVKAASDTKETFTLFVTGRRSKAGTSLRYEGEKIRFTDFLPHEDFDALIQHSDLLVDLTTRENCLVCGAYEALAVEVPVLLSDTNALRQTFSGASFTQNSAEGFRASLVSSLQHLDQHKQ
ncbi:MAG: glycosyltransferase family 4 protein, partial [Caldilineaceae bacterium]|nr:glycosyltransferase family 4 protein [Caldilineaceae bacterium]